MNIPYFRVNISEEEIAEVADSLRSGWLTTGPKVKRFEADFAASVGTSHAVALSSCTAALHLALEAIGVRRGDLVLVPTMTFAATAEVVRYFDAQPVFVDCGEDFNMNPDALEATIKSIEANRPVAGLKPPYGALRSVIPMHYGGYSCQMELITPLAQKHGLTVIEDAAHAFPASYRPTKNDPWTPAGRFGRIGCFSFYANKCITTGEGGMAITDDEALADRMRVMSLHGMNRDAWKRYTAQGSWYYELIAPGYKYNLTDIAAALGIHQLQQAEAFRLRRQEIARRYNDRFNTHPVLITPPDDPDTRKHSWHLYSLRLRLENLTIDRAAFIDELRNRGVFCSVHWMPLHLHPYYRQALGNSEGLFPCAEDIWRRQLSLPIYPAMSDGDIENVISTVVEVADKFSR